MYSLLLLSWHCRRHSLSGWSVHRKNFYWSKDKFTSYKYLVKYTDEELSIGVNRQNGDEFFTYFEMTYIFVLLLGTGLNEI